MKQSICIALITASIGLGGCSKAKESHTAPGAAQAAAPTVPLTKSVPSIPGNTSGWTQSEATSADQSVKITKLEMTLEEYEKTKREYRRTDLVEIPVASLYNAAVFQINNVEEYKKTAFLAPKVFAYGSANEGKLSQKNNKDGTVTLTFPVLLSDGTVAEVQSPSSDEKVTLPENFQVQNLAGLKEDIKSRHPEIDNIAPLPGCPKKITVKVGDVDYDATPDDLINGDYCPQNIPFNVSIRLKNEDATEMLTNALYKNAVEVRATFETKVSFAVSNLSIEFDKAKVFSDIQAELAVFYPPYADADVKAKVTKVMKNGAMKVSMQGDMTPVLETAVNQAIALFFEPSRPDPVTGLKECGAIVCLRLNYNYSKEESTFQFKWDQSDNAMTGQSYVTWTKLKPLQDKAVVIDRLKNDRSAIGTGLTLKPGSKIEIHPTQVIKEQRAIAFPIRRKISNFVNGADNFSWVTQYSTEPTLTALDQPATALPYLYEKLTLRFTIAGQHVDCPLTSFPVQGDGSSMIIEIRNQSNCQVFAKNSETLPTLSIINEIIYNEEYIEGSLVEYWNGTTTSVPHPASFSPQIWFSGAISVRGDAFTSVSPNSL